MNEDQVRTLVECEQRSKSNSHRLDRLEANWEALNKLAVSVETMGVNIANMDKTIQKLDRKVEEQAAKPAKRWEAVAEKAILVVVGAVIAWMLSRIGM